MTRVMTREEAIKTIQELMVACTPDSKYYKVGEMAIKALSQEPCDDAISREQAIKVIRQITSRYTLAKESCGMGQVEWSDHLIKESDAIDGLNELPSVNMQKSGKWIVDGSGDCYLDTVKCHCSECGKKKKFPADYDHIKQELSISYRHPEFIDNYCPNCGAYMVEPQESEV